MFSNVFKILEERGFIEQISDDSLSTLFEKEQVTCYVGFDPSGKSLHVGHLLPIMALSHVQHCGHISIGLLGGGTGMIGDPSGKSEERVLLSEEDLERNAEGVKAQLYSLLKPEKADAGKVMIINNADWLAKYSLIEFLRDIGKHFRIGDMLAKESVKRRMEGEGISFTEFSYMLLQSADFLHLLQDHNCTVQFGGSDQWGNITAGIDLIRRITGKQAYGGTFPLITTASGQKLGKTEKGAIFLDPEMTSPYEFYQYWINTDDKDVIKYLKWFTFLPLSEIDELAKATAKEPEARKAQRVLAYEVTSFIHGVEKANIAVKTSEILFGKEISDVSDEMLEEIFKDVPSTEISKDALETGLLLIDAMVQCGISKGRSAAKRLIDGGGVYINNMKVIDSEYKITKESLASSHISVLRTGKRNYHLMRFE
ncbi:TPA: tyrosine--tRNA ligase [bacterium]|nr:tyrosine--tRNA ligase [bacterium]